MIPEAGQKFGPYEILGRLGGGAMGIVFRAWDARLHREVAIKLLHDDYQMPGMRERFLQEARAASALNHPNICTIFDLGEQDGEPYMVMELLEGETLKEKISRGAVAADEIISYAQEVADALAAAHAKGIVHRDVKPANIFLVNQPNSRRQAKVLDFGLAKVGITMHGGRASRVLDLTLAGATVGTLSYMSPEQARGQVLDERSDLFSLGVVMYEMATRQVPFQGATSALIFVQLLNHAPEPVHVWNDSIPKELEKIILKLLSKERDARFQSGHELAEALRRIPFKSGGGWLRRAAAAVPLVRTADPVARGKRSMRGTSPAAKTPPAPVSTPKPETRRVSSGDNTLIRPVARTPYDSGSRDEGVLRGIRSQATAVAVKGESSASMEAAINSLGAHAAANAASSASLKKDEMPVASQSGSGITQFGLGMQKPQDKPVPELRAPLLENSVPVKKEHVSVAIPERLVATKTASVSGQARRSPILILTAAIIAILCGTAYFLATGKFRPILLREGDPILLTVIQNRTGDKSLDGTVMQGLELELQQTQYLSVQGGEAYRAGLRQAEAEGSTGSSASGRRIAQMMGAKAYLYGEIRGSGSPYTISVDVLKTDSNDKLTSIEETAQGKDQIADAIDRIASQIRVDMGEKARQIAKTSIPLQQEGTSNIDALKAYTDGESTEEAGRTDDAIVAYQKATAADPKFAEAHLHLAWLYRAQHAESAAAAEGKLAQDAATSGGDRLKLLTQFCYELNASGDYAQAEETLKRFKELYPHDMSGVLAEARLLLAQGHMPEALQAAQTVYSQDPYSREAYEEAETATLGIDRYQGVMQLQEQAHKLRVFPQGRTLAAAYLGQDAQALTREIAAVKNMGAQTSWSLQGDYGLYLDNAGRLAAGTDFWHKATEGPGNGAFASAQSYLLAQAALDRALAGSCTQATEFLKAGENLSKGLIATFNEGLAGALCGDKSTAEQAMAALKQGYPQSTAVAGYYVADLEAAMALEAGDSKGALKALTAAAPYDEVSLTPYLRGLAHLGTGEAVLAVADFQTIADHRGAAFIAGSDVYPMAQMGLARAYGALGDQLNSKAAYRRFAELWQDGDRSQPLLAEAVAKGH